MPYTLKSCGVRHSHCSVCDPRVGPRIRAALKGRTVSEERRARMSDVLRGRRPSAATRAKISSSVTMAHERAPGFNQTRGPTALEFALQLLLEDAGLDFDAQVNFGSYIVDAWVPSHRLVFEADGMFWYHHQDAAREARRDAYLMQRGAFAVVHLNDGDLKPWEPR